MLEQIENLEEDYEEPREDPEVTELLDSVSEVQSQLLNISIQARKNNNRVFEDYRATMNGVDKVRQRVESYPTSDEADVGIWLDGDWHLNMGQVRDKLSDEAIDTVSKQQQHDYSDHHQNQLLYDDDSERGERDSDLEKDGSEQGKYDSDPDWSGSELEGLSPRKHSDPVSEDSQVYLIDNVDDNKQQSGRD